MSASGYPGFQDIQDGNCYDSPEHINDSPITAPSKRILRCCPGYDKPLHGSLIAMDIGLDTIRKQSQHFDKWLTKLENIK